MAHDSTRRHVIAEAGVNHNGSLDIAHKMVEVAACAGADTIKFQTFRAERLTSRTAPKADYQRRETDANQSQLDMLRGLELSENAHRELLQHCSEKGIVFMSSPFDTASLAFLAALNVHHLKLGSGEVTNAPLLLAAAQTGLPLILSTGMCTLAEVEEALSVLAFGYLKSTLRPSRESFRQSYDSDKGQVLLRTNVTLLHCTSEYPAPYSEVNLAAMETLQRAFGLPVGFSDHTEGIAIPIAAVARGAVVIEKHFTLDRTLPGPDHRASLEPAELTAMVAGIRQVEVALGDGIKRPSASEIKNMPIARKSIVAARNVTIGEVFSEDNLTSKRPGGGISPMDFWEWEGRRASRDFAEDEPIE